MLFTIALIMVAIIVVIVLISYNANWCNLPPSLCRIYFIGNLPQLIFSKKPAHIFFGLLSKKLGPVTTFWFGALPLVIVNDFEIGKKVLNSLNFSGRPQRIAGSISSRGFKGIIIKEYTQQLKCNRTLATKANKWYSKVHLDKHLKGEADEFINSIKLKLKNSDSNIVDVGEEINLATCNVMFQLLFNRRIKKDLGEYTDVLNLLNWLNKGLLYANVIQGLPFLRILKPKYMGILKGFETLRDRIVSTEFDLHLKQFSKEKLKDFTDFLLNETLDRDEKEIIISDYFIAGSETTATAISFIIIYLLLNEDIKQKCIDEINTIIGKDQELEINMLDKLQYVSAVVAETLRIRPPSQVSLPHKAVENDKVCGYSIPKNTSILVNIYHIHHDPLYHEDPDTFKPSRFLNSDNNFQTIEGFLPFSEGRRKCIGQKLAWKEILFFTVTFLRRVSFEKADEVDISDEPMCTSILKPQPFRFKINQIN